jgi:prolipoprotein diacylglyceryltransferase
MPLVIDIDPVAFSLLGVPVRWYGLILVVAPGLAACLNGRTGPTPSLQAEDSQP